MNRCKKTHIPLKAMVTYILFCAFTDIKKKLLNLKKGFDMNLL